ncbi:carboxylesterase [Microbulbifer sp. GL-2]|uniref:alpha/beta hydrolase n=1 Tax=Microbulbifer sp. GL-2 TaxID=2591606 RepID=UPI001162C4CB|nr:alpha/beta hydrolase [Microbulbifer sp. GL-2]BBM02652.1 alpha/beta hydrolase [Microbulbifer sp. GL-2]
MENFHKYFEQKGFTCHSPAYRHHDIKHSEEKRNPLIGTSIRDYVRDTVNFVKNLNKKPILVGHSLGGVIAQKIAAKGLAKAIVLLNGSINWGILPTTDQECVLGRTLMTSGKFWESVLLPDFEIMARFGLNKLNTKDQHKAFDQLGPESGKVFFELFFWIFDENKTTKVEYEKIMCPVLMVSGSDDFAIPPSTSYLIAKQHYSKTTFYIAEGYGHYLMLEPNWLRIAEFCKNWIINQERMT